MLNKSIHFQHMNQLTQSFQIKFEKIKKGERPSQEYWGILGSHTRWGYWKYGNQSENH